MLDFIRSIAFRVRSVKPYSKKLDRCIKRIAIKDSIQYLYSSKFYDFWYDDEQGVNYKVWIGNGERCFAVCYIDMRPGKTREILDNSVSYSAYTQYEEKKQRYLNNPTPEMELFARYTYNEGTTIATYNEEVEKQFQEILHNENIIYAETAKYKNVKDLIFVDKDDRNKFYIVSTICMYFSEEWAKKVNIDHIKGRPKFSTMVEIFNSVKEEIPFSETIKGGTHVRF